MKKENEKIQIVAEIGQSHEGSLGLLHSYIDAVAETGADVIKFQMHIADAESSQHEEFRVKFSYVDKTRYDYWKRMEFTEGQWKEIKNHCEKKGLEFLCSPFSIAAVNILEEIGVKRYKIGAGEITNFLLLEKIANTGKEIIISSGMSDFNELDEVVGFLKPFKNKLTILQCTTKYPTLPEDIGLNVIPELKKRYKNCAIGFSDHSGAIYSGLAAAAVGAELIEVHVVFDRRMFGPDSSSSLTIGDLKKLVEGVRFIRIARSHEVDKTDSRGFQNLRNMFGKSLSVNKDLPAGHVLTFDDLETKKPCGKGIHAKDYGKIIGKKLKVAKAQYDFLNEGDIAG